MRKSTCASTFRSATLSPRNWPKRLPQTYLSVAKDMSKYVHGDNIAQKKAHKTKYRTDEHKKCLAEIEPVYVKWKAANEELVGTDEATVIKRTELLNEYKDFIDQQCYAELFDSRSNLHSSVLEEFLLYLFKDSIPNLNLDPIIGKGETFKSFFLAPKNFEDLLEKPAILVETKDHDFVIGMNLHASFANQRTQLLGAYTFQIPAVAIECKTYLDKTMLEGASISAEELKRINPNARYLIMAEWLKLTEAVNLRKYRIDQIYVLRKQKNTDREFRFAEGYVKNPIYADLVYQLYREVIDYLSAERWDIDAALAKGKLL